MTRINCIPVTELNVKMLVCEYREMLRARHWKVYKRELPDSYRLGTGHCLFFHNKGLYLMRRHKELIEEMKRRGYTVNLPQLDLSHWPNWALNEWIPDSQAMKLNRERIAERLKKNGLP